MRVKLTETYASPEFSGGAGQIHDVSDELGKRIVESKMGVEIVAPKLPEVESEASAGGPENQMDDSATLKGGKADKKKRK